MKVRKSFMAIGRSRAIWLRRVITVAAAATVIGGTTSGAAAAGTVDKPTGNQHCLLAEQSTQPTCYVDFRAAMNAATAGQVADAPLDPADLDDRTIQRIAASGDAASAARLTGRAAAAKVVLSIGYTGRNYTSSSLSLISSTKCAGSGTKDYDSFPTGWDNNFHSYRNVSDCVSRYYEDVNQRGRYETWYRNDGQPNAVYAGLISSARLMFGPDRAHLVKMCGTSSDVRSCTFTATSQGADASEDFHEVGMTYNCGPGTSDLAVSWSETSGGAIWLASSLTLTATYNIGTLASLSAAITVETGQEWNWSKTSTGTTTINDVGTYQWGRIDRAPKLQFVKGYLDVKLKKSMWGSDSWRVYDFKGVVEVPGHTGVTRTKKGDMTAEQIARVCSGRSSSTLTGPTTLTSHHQITTLS